MSATRTRLAAWYLGRKVQPEASRWAEQVMEAMSDLRLIVIDSEDRGQAERLMGDYYGLASVSTHAVAKMQAALRSLIAPPKPDEPQGLGAVVEDAEGGRWIRVWGAGLGNAWIGASGPNEPDVFVDYADITAVRVLGEGWTP